MSVSICPGERKGVSFPFMRSITPASKLAGDPDAAHEWGTRHILIDQHCCQRKPTAGPSAVPSKIQGSLHFAADGETVRCFGRDDVSFARDDVSFSRDDVSE